MRNHIIHRFLLFIGLIFLPSPDINHYHSHGKLCSIPTIDDDNLHLKESEFRNNNHNPFFIQSMVPLPQLESKPGKAITLILDFDGHPAHTWAGENVPTTPAFDRDGDATTLSQAEADTITEIWRRVAESYSPFDVNVTTIDNGSYPVNSTAKVIIGGDNTWLGGGGGVAILSSMAYASPRWSFCFSKNLGNGHGKYTADCVAHEAGHMLGLNHQATYSGTTLISAYNQGNADVAPIMGVAYYSTRGLWWYGPTDIAYNNMQDDIPLMDGGMLNFAIAADDHGNVKDNATSLSISSLTFSAQGIIERLSDTDVFAFSSGAGTVNISVSPNSSGPTLDIKAELKDANGNSLAAADPSNSLAASLSAAVSDGNYFLYISSNGSNLGDLGTYSVSGTIPALSSNTPVASNTATSTPVATSTFTPTATATDTATPVPSSTPTPQATATNTQQPPPPPPTATATPTSTPTTIARLQIISPLNGTLASKTVNLKIFTSQLDTLMLNEKQGRNWIMRIPKSSGKIYGFRYSLRGNSSDMTVRGYLKNKLIAQQSIAIKLGKGINIKQSRKG